MVSGFLLSQYSGGGRRGIGQSLMLVLMKNNDETVKICYIPRQYLLSTAVICFDKATKTCLLCRSFDNTGVLLIQ